MRQVIAVALSLSLLAAALGAPLVHAHPDDHATEHHDGQEVHTHWAGHARSHHARSGPSLAADDYDRAVYVNAFVAVGTASFSLPSVVLTVFELPVPAERRSQRGIDVVRSHDPPTLIALASRAPPAFLS